MNSERVILDLCGGTGGWSQPYREAGYDVRVIDPVAPPHHPVQLLKKITEPVHGILAAPPCTDLAGSGARWWDAKGTPALYSALAVVDACLRVVMVHKPRWWALENPVGRLVHYLGKPALYFQPWEYGDPYTKKTCLWGEFTAPKKNPVAPIRVCSQGSWVQKLGGKSDRTKRLRSITPAGFARAFFEANP